MEEAEIVLFNKDKEITYPLRFLQEPVPYKKHWGMKIVYYTMTTIRSPEYMINLNNLNKDYLIASYIIPWDTQVSRHTQRKQFKKYMESLDAKDQHTKTEKWLHYDEDGFKCHKWWETSGYIDYENEKKCL